MTSRPTDLLPAMRPVTAGGGTPFTMTSRRSGLLLLPLALWMAHRQAGAGQGQSGRLVKVGPGQAYERLAAALPHVRPGDTIAIDSRGDYTGDVGFIRTDRLTIRGVGPGRPVFAAAGRHAGGKGIWVVQGNQVTIENIEFRGARVPDRNGAGIRAEGRHLTVRHCKFDNCENGILGGAGIVTIEHCEFSRCGPTGLTHNLYIAPADRLVFRFNYSHHAKVGHLLKSRARENYIAYNYLSDERDGSSSYIIDLPNGGRSFLIGNVLCQSPHTNNSTLVAYGQEGVKYDDSSLYVINNTFVNNRHLSIFLQIRRVRPGFRMVVRNNIFFGRGTVCTYGSAVMEGNFAGDPRFVDAKRFDFRLLPGSPCIGKGVDPGKANGLSLRPRFQYRHPCGKEDRPDDGRLDIGAFEWSR